MPILGPTTLEHLKLNVTLIQQVQHLKESLSRREGCQMVELPMIAHSNLKKILNETNGAHHRRCIEKRSYQYEVGFTMSRTMFSNLWVLNPCATSPFIATLPKVKQFCCHLTTHPPHPLSSSSSLNFV